MQPFDFHPRTRVIFGTGSLGRLGALAGEIGMQRPLLVADPGLVATGHAAQAVSHLSAAGLTAACFHDFGPDPDTAMVEAGRTVAAAERVDGLIGLGGGSSMDCAKAINFLLTNGGAMHDYHGFGKASRPMLPMIGVPTTAGTGSEAQSYAIISDARTHAKMACGDPKAAFRIAVLDPSLTLTQPPLVTAAAGFDAIAHAVETWVTTRRTPLSDLFSREAWRLLEANYERVLRDPGDLEARGAMQIGAFYAGTAIEQSMLGATHACANPLTARYRLTHGLAIALLLPHVVRWNAEAAEERYAELVDLSQAADAGGPAAERLALRLEALVRAGGLPVRLREAGVQINDLAALSAEAATQWTGQFNPRPFDAEGARAVYDRAF